MIGIGILDLGRFIEEKKEIMYLETQFHLSYFMFFKPIQYASL